MTSLIRVLSLLVCSALKGKHGDKANVYATKCDVSNADDVEKLAQVPAPREPWRIKSAHPCPKTLLDARQIHKMLLGTVHEWTYHQTLDPGPWTLNPEP